MTLHRHGVPPLPSHERTLMMMNRKELQLRWQHNRDMYLLLTPQCTQLLQKRRQKPGMHNLFIQQGHNRYCELVHGQHVQPWEQAAYCLHHCVVLWCVCVYTCAYLLDQWIEFGRRLAFRRPANTVSNRLRAVTATRITFLGSWGFTRRVHEVGWRRFGTPCRFHLRRSSKTSIISQYISLYGTKALLRS
jgi:hypothetical protein